MPNNRYIVTNGTRFNTAAENEAEIARVAEALIKGLSDPLTEEEKYSGPYELPKHPYYLYEGNSYIDAMAAYEGDLTRHDEDGYVAAPQYTDGSAIQLPTDELVEAMLAATERDRDELVSEGTEYGGMGPGYDPITVLNVAVNGVMAGCKPEYMPVLLAITEAMCNTYIQEALAGAGGYFSFGVVVSGPIGKEIGMNDGVAGASGLTPGILANTTIGRFIRLMMINCGGTEPGALEAKGAGTPLKTSVVVYESETSPWPALTSTKPIGLEDGESTVAFFVNWGDILYAYNANTVYTGPESSEEEMLIQKTLGNPAELAKNMTRPQQGLFMLVGQNNAVKLSDAGFSREDVVHWISTHIVDTYEDAYARGLGKGVAGTHFKIQGVPIWETGNWPEEWSDPDFDPQTIVQWFPNEDAISLVVSGQREVIMNGNPRWSVYVDPWR